MHNKQKTLITILALFLFVLLPLAGCVEKENESEDTFTTENLKEVAYDSPSILPDWIDGEYHNYEFTTKTLKYYENTYPDLVDVFSIGKSVLGRDIWCIRITNENNNSDKYSCVIDGCIHGSEWESAEYCLYFAEYLLINYDSNKTITDIVNKSEIYFIPILNPDGREQDVRYNENGIDLNRNFDVHFGRIKGGSFSLGKLFGFIKIPSITIPGKGIYTNAGRYPFSEPETAALRDFMQSLDYEKLSFYLNCHTAVHAIVSVINIDYKPEFSVTDTEKEALNTVLYWMDENTQYDIMPVDDYSIRGGGVAHHWVFKEFGIPSFCFELLSQDYEPGYTGGGPHGDLVYWMEESLPVLMYLLVNIENLNGWETPDIEPILPEGIPPSQN